MTRLTLAFALMLVPAVGAADTPAPDPEAVAAGAAIFERRCSQCHGLDGVNYKGPYLNGILGRASATVADWAYSQPMRDWGGVWTEENLRLWLTKPQDLIPGTEMNFGGFRNRTEDRDRVIAFLLAQPQE